MSSSENTSNKQSNPFLNRLDVDGEDGDEFIDHWDTGELLFLSSSVLQSDRNWASVARSIKPYGELSLLPHPSDWYTPKNCALQYTKLLDAIEDDSLKKALPRTERETPEAMLVKNLTEKRLKELEQLNRKTKVAAETLKMQIENLENGHFDDNLDDLINDLENQEQRDEEFYNEYLVRREHLNTAKKLNRSRIARGKSPANISGLKKKASVTQDIIQESVQQFTAEEIYKNSNIEINEDIPSVQKVVHTEDEVTPADVNVQPNSVVSVPSSFPQSSPLLTSLLSSVAFPSSGPQNSSSISTPVRKPNPVDDLDANKEEMDIVDIKQCSPKYLETKSPPSTSDSSPLLNSLLKNSPSTSVNLFTSPGKEISPSAASSPRPFFNPASALASAAAQQLVVATSTSNQQIFQQLDLPENHQTNLQFFKAASSCSAAPTLSKLLEMPPSTPGKLPPLPVLDSPVSSALSTSIQTAKDSEQSIPGLCSEAASKIDNLPKESSFPTNTSMLQKSLTSYSLADKKNITLTDTEGSKETLGSEENLNRKRRNNDDPSQESIDILEAVCESINKAFEEKEKQKLLDQNKKLETKGIKDLTEQAASISKIEDIEVNKFCIGELSSSIDDNQISLFEDDMNHTFTSSDRKYSEESIDSSSSTTFDFTLNKSEVPSEEVRKASEKKFYKSRASNRKESITENNKEPSSLFESPGKSVRAKSESEISAASFTSIISSVVESTKKKQEDSNSSSPVDSESPEVKNVRTYERDSIETMEMLEVQVPVTPRTYSRRGKRRRGRPAKSTPIKQVEPEDQYEFTESTEENSVVYRTSNTLCYMPRVKEDFQLDDSKEKASSPMDSEGMTSNSTSPSTCRTNVKLLGLNEEPSSFQLLNATRALFGSDERISDSLTSDETSNHFLNEDKFGTWGETCGENDDDASKSSIENSKCFSDVIDVSMKKCSTPVRSSRRKGRKLSSVFLEEVPTSSRDSEEMPAQNPANTKEKNLVPVESVAMGIKSNDSPISTRSAIESSKSSGSIEECDSLQSSITTNVSLPSTNETEGQESLCNKQDLYNIVSPRCSETILQSSDESEEDESDNWDSQSASTNKSSSLSSETRPRLRRKERDTAEYKAWKKAISMVLREVSCHKNANIFLQKVTNDVAPGYLNIVHRPMDLSLIKKNIDTGIIRTTDEFHRDMLLMFQNAIMYNSSDHDVHQMAVEMQRDVVKQISAFLATQSRNKEAINEPSSLRDARAVKSHKRPGKQSTAANSSKQKDETD